MSAIIPIAENDLKATLNFAGFSRFQGSINRQIHFFDLYLHQKINRRQFPGSCHCWNSQIVGTAPLLRETMKITKCYILIALLLNTAAGCVGTHSPGPRLEGSVLNSCSDSPNCVSSQGETSSRKIAPFNFTGTPEAAFAKLHKILAARPDTRITISIPTYIKVEFRTFLGFIDDGEFYLDAKKKVIECRSASRKGYWDLGKNRRRIEEIRDQFNKE
jgi:uncharacterized protein (DUF1499 family)